MIKMLPDECFPISETLFEGLELYVNHRVRPGDFLRAVLENNLSEAFGRADIRNSNNMRNIISYVRQHVPNNRWGSAEKVEAWLNGQ